MQTETGPTEFRSCVRKRRHKTEEDALRAAKRSTKERSKQLSVYQCHLCGGWHLTSRPPRARP